jgi:hypothetical protein
VPLHLQPLWHASSISINEAIRKLNYYSCTSENDPRRGPKLVALPPTTKETNVHTEVTILFLFDYLLWQCPTFYLFIASLLRNQGRSLVVGLQFSSVALNKSSFHFISVPNL